MNAKKMLLLIVMVALLFTAPTVRTAETDDYLMYAGTYTGGASKGIYAFRFQPSTGKTVSIGLAVESANPSFLAVHPDRRTLYAVNEALISDGGNGSISAFAIDAKTGRLTFLNKMSSGGRDPCHLTIDRYGKWLLAANYSSGSVSVFPIKEDGRLGPASALMQHSGSGKDPRRQQGPHAHSVNLSPDGRFLLVSDLGLDKILIYRFDSAKGSLAVNDPPFVKLSAGSGPRHISFHPNGRFVYQTNELSSTLTAFAYDADGGSLREVETISTLPQDFSGNSTTAEVAVHPDGTFVYGSNRGHDSIAVFAVKGDKCILEPVEYVSTRGKMPRHFAIDPTGNFLFAANQNSGEIVLFRIDRATGKLTATDVVLKVPNPVCVVFVRLRQ
jgi:6-phosphogluconolactonase